MILLKTLDKRKVLINPIHIVLVKETKNDFGEKYVEIYCGSERLDVSEDFGNVQLMLHQFNK